MYNMGIGDWGLGIGDWGLGPILTYYLLFSNNFNQNNKLSLKNINNNILNQFFLFVFVLNIKQKKQSNEIYFQHYHL